MLSVVVVPRHAVVVQEREHLLAAFFKSTLILVG
jgi:hypothetical protein